MTRRSHYPRVGAIKTLSEIAQKDFGFIPNKGEEVLPRTLSLYNEELSLCLDIESLRNHCRGYLDPSFWIGLKFYFGPDFISFGFDKYFKQKASIFLFVYS